MIPVGLWISYHFIVQPLEQARRSGHLEYYLKGVLLGPLAVYLGIAILMTDLRDGQVRTIDPAGRKHFTRKGRLFVAGVIVVMCLSLAGWFGALHAMGFTGSLP